MNKVIFALFLGMIAHGACAEIVSVDRKINIVKARSSGAFEMELSSAVGQNCYSGDKRVKAFLSSNGLNQEGLNKMYSLALAAKLSSRTVRVWFNNNDSNCTLKEMSIL